MIWLTDRTKCKKMVYVASRHPPCVSYAAIMAQVDASLNALYEGVNLPAGLLEMPVGSPEKRNAHLIAGAPCPALMILLANWTDRTGYKEEASVLQAKIAELLELFPETVFPIAHLHIRLAHVVMDLVSAEPIFDLKRWTYHLAIHHLQLAARAMRKWYATDGPCLDLLSIGLIKIECHMRAVAGLLDTFKIKDDKVLAYKLDKPKAPKVNAAGEWITPVRKMPSPEKDMNAERGVRTTKAIMRARSSIDRRQHELLRATVHCEQLSDAIMEATADAAILALQPEAPMMAKLVRYELRCAKLRNWLRKQNEVLKQE
jgi:hypothetical protein